MLKLSEIKKDMKHGDGLLIHQKSQIPLDTVKAILSGRRNDQTKTGQKILRYAKALIRTRENFLTQELDEPLSKPAAKKSKKAPNQIEIFSNPNI